MNFDSLANEMIQRRFDPSQIQTKLEMSKTNKTEHMILYYLYMFQGKKVYPKDLQHLFQTSSARIAGILKNMEADGLLLRSIDLEDNRKVMLSITSKGIEETEHLHDKMKQILTKTLEDMGAEDAVAFVRLDHKFHLSFIKAMDEYNNIAT